jgi:hypothetical protein
MDFGSTAGLRRHPDEAGAREERLGGCGVRGSTAGAAAKALLSPCQLSRK